jgi:hypothetical protein
MGELKLICGNENWEQQQRRTNNKTILNTNIKKEPGTERTSALQNKINQII